MERGLKVPPTSRKRLRAQAVSLRSQLGIEDDYFPIVELLDIGLGHHFPDFVLDVMPKEKMVVEHGVTIPDEGLMVIREDVYMGALEGKGRDRFTLAHELGHLLLHRGVTLARARFARRLTHAPYEDSEWQANTFASELLMPIDSVKRCPSEFDLSDLCGVSVDAAEVRFSVLRGEKIIR